MEKFKTTTNVKGNKYKVKYIHIECPDCKEKDKKIKELLKGYDKVSRDRHKFKEENKKLRKIIKISEDYIVRLKADIKKIIFDR